MSFLQMYYINTPITGITLLPIYSIKLTIAGITFLLTDLLYNASMTGHSTIFDKFVSWGIFVRFDIFPNLYALHNPNRPLFRD